MDKFHQRHSYSYHLTQEMEFVVKNAPQKEVPSPDGLTGEFSQPNKKLIITIIYKLQKIGKEH